jgi:hypothetical protein
VRGDGRPLDGPGGFGVGAKVDGPGVEAAAWHGMRQDRHAGLPGGRARGHGHGGVIGVTRRVEHQQQVRRMLVDRAPDPVGEFGHWLTVQRTVRVVGHCDL